VSASVQKAQASRLFLPGVLGILAVAEFMLTLDLSIVNVAMPAVRADLGFSQESLLWVVNGYALSFGGFLLLGGRAADFFGGRRVFLSALTAFSLASLACALAPSQAALISARVIQGLSAGLLSPATLSLLTETYHEPSQRNRALSVWTAVAIGGGAVGALLGGVVVDVLSWRWIFFVNVPIGGLLVVLGTRVLARRTDEKARQQLDVGGAIAATTALMVLSWALIRSGDVGWHSGQVIAGLAGAAALLAGFVVIETRVARAPLVPFVVFRSRLLSVSNVLSFLSFVPVMAAWFFLTLYVQGVRGNSPTAAGLLFVPMALAVVGGSQISFRAISRLDSRLLFSGGGLAAAAGMAWLGSLSAETTMAFVILPACIVMAGGGLMFAPITVAATSGAASDQGGLASGLLNTTRQIGGALGLAILGTIASAHTTRHISEGLPVAQSGGYATAFTVAAAIFVATAIVGAAWLPAQLDKRVDR
jgi:EmrB/QacA subfamily drug resistance transporter